MLKRVIFIGFLILPGACIVLVVACAHPRLRKAIIGIAGLSGPLDRMGYMYALLSRRSRGLSSAARRGGATQRRDDNVSLSA